MTTFVCNICKCQDLFALLQLTTFVCTIASNNYCQHHRCLYAYFKFPFSVGTIGTGILVMHCCIWYFCTMLIKIFNSFCIWQLLYALLQLTTFVCTIASDNYCQLYCCPYAYFIFPFSVGTILTDILVTHGCIWYFSTMLIKIFNSFCIWQLLYVPFMYDCKWCFINAGSQILHAAI